ncbi:MAG: response regulator, partial [Phycisphaerae bacterium]|nr:response regulator [Phycisphaerae bacterium]
MIRITAKTRIAFGQVCILVSVLLLAMILGLVPDRQGAITEGRAELCESMAVNTAILMDRGDVPGVNVALESAVARNSQILSLALRRADGKAMVVVGDHERNWVMDGAGKSVDTQVQVPIRAGESKWGALEVRFRPVVARGPWAFFKNPWTLLLSFVGVASFILFYLFLRKMLQHLDPSKVVPGRVRNALDTLAEGLVVLDRSEQIVLANESFATAVGVESQKLLGEKVSDFDWQAVDADEQADLVYPWTKAIETQGAISGSELGLETADGRHRMFIVNTQPVLGQDGKYRGVLVSFEDVTTLEEQKVELRIAKLAADDANQAKSDFLARMSHEIRTPMNAILGFADLLRRGFDANEDERQEYLQTIHSSGRHLLNLINDILDLSKVEADKLEVELQPCSAYAIVADVVTTLGTKAQEKGLKLDLRVEDRIPNTITTDAGRVRQIVTNLVGNALKFTEVGNVTVVLRQAGSQAQPQLAIDVVDTGIGMTPEQVEKVFNPFEQADSSITRRFGGTGLGLAISLRFAEALGGGITATSAAGKGTTFTVALNTGSLEDSSLCTGEELAATTRATDTDTADLATSLPTSRILLADDGEANRRLISLVLERAGATVDTAINGQEAVNAATTEQYDLVLMDMQMPIMNGYEASTRLRELGYEQPIIALTANAMKGDEKRCLDAGCSGYLSKPIDMDRLVATLAAILGRGETQTAPAKPATTPAPATTPEIAATPSPTGNQLV